MLQWIAHELRLAGVALQFLTRVPVPLRGFDPEWLPQSARHFPLVGLGVGAFVAAVLWLASLVWPVPVAAPLAVAAGVWLTGAFHEDGLADTCDGLGGAVERERALVIMKDSRLGSYGALGLVLTLIVKVAALAWLADRALPVALAACVFAHGVSRTAAVALMAALPYAGDAEHAKARPLATRIGVGGLVVALGWSATAGLGLAGSGLLDPLQTLAALGAVAAVALLCGRWFQRRLGGFTGDTLGATQQWSEVAVLLVFVAHG
jgi:adenosylcobinamide-GDP ribazoletransferase